MPARRPISARPPPRCPRGAIGLCWQAGGWDTARSVPVELLAPVFAGRQVVALQRDPPPAALGALNPHGCGADIAGTAALAAGLGLIVTVDTMVAHLAGALGRPCWLMLKHDADWRWMADRADSPWYPSMRLFRQPAPGDWGAVAAQVADALAAWQAAATARG